MEYNPEESSQPLIQQLELRSVIFAAKIKSGTLIFHSEEHNKIYINSKYVSGRLIQEFVQPNSFLFVTSKPTQAARGHILIPVLYDNKKIELEFSSARELYKYFNVYQILQ